MVQWLILILVYDIAIFKLSFGEVTLAIRLLHYRNRNGLTYENRPCDTRLDHDINRDGRCDTGFLFCLVRLPFQNPHNCTLGDHFTGFVGADDIYFVNIDERHEPSALAMAKKKQQRSTIVSLWFQRTIYFRFPYPKNGMGLIVEVFDIDDIQNQTIHDSIDFYGRTLLDLKIDRSVDLARPQRLYLRSLFGTYTNLTADFSLYCSANYYGNDCDTYCSPNPQRYECDPITGEKICNTGYFGYDCLNDLRACEDQPCLNNGTCVVYLRSYLCQCERGFAGRSCEINLIEKINEHRCNRETCIHGNCSTDGKCICHEGWQSDRCDEHQIQRQSACASRPCLHNSTCESLLGIDPFSAYRCHCPPGYTGRNCEVALVNACERTPCLHGQCLKIDLYTEICICEENWSGIDCSRALPTRSLTSTTSVYLPSSSPKLSSVMTTTSTALTSAVTLIQSSPSVTGKSNIHDSLDSYNENTDPTSTESTSKITRNSPCSSNPCLHNSTCVVKSESSFQCICSSTFIGIYCEIEKNPCEHSPCQHQSVCITTSTHEVRCICRPHYTGKYCENPPAIRPFSTNTRCTRPCNNGGSCSIDQLKNEYCQCPNNFTGSSCETSINNCSNSTCYFDPCSSNPCLANGTCHANHRSINYTCTCPELYTGENCEIDETFDFSSNFSHDRVLNRDEFSSSHDPNTELWPLAIVFGYVFSLMLVFIIIWFLWYGLSLRSRSTYRSDIPYGERSHDYYQPYRLGVSNPLFFSNQEHYPEAILKTFPH